MKIAPGTIVITPGKPGTRTDGMVGVSARKRLSKAARTWRWFSTGAAAKAHAMALRGGACRNYNIVTWNEWQEAEALGARKEEEK